MDFTIINFAYFVNFSFDWIVKLGRKGTIVHPFPKNPNISETPADSKPMVSDFIVCQLPYLLTRFGNWFEKSRLEMQRLTKEGKLFFGSSYREFEKYKVKM